MNAMPKGVYPHTHIKPKVYPAELVERVSERYYGQNMSIAEVAVDLGVGGKIIRRLMINHNMPRRPKIKRDQSGARNSTWRGDDASYNALHSRVARKRGRPKCCEQCGTTEATGYEWANLTGRYADPDDYARMCIPCHRQFDGDRRALTGKRTCDQLQYRQERGDAA